MTDDLSTYAARAGIRMQEARESRGLSLKAVEAKSGGRFTAGQIGHWEAARRGVLVWQLAAYAEFLGVPLTDLLPEDARQGAWVQDQAREVAGRAVADLAATCRSATPDIAPSLLKSALTELEAAS